jgi:hypothetical protein
VRVHAARSSDLKQKLALAAPAECFEAWRPLSLSAVSETLRRHSTQG